MKLAVIAASFALAGAAHASGFGGAVGIGGVASGFAGEGHGYANVATNGGSMAQGNVNGTGFSAQYTTNAGGGYAGAGAGVTPSGVDTWSNGSSYAQNVSAGYTAGNATGSTAGGVGTDFSSSAWGNFHTGAAGGFIGLGGFAGFGSF